MPARKRARTDETGSAARDVTMRTDKADSIARVAIAYALT